MSTRDRILDSIRAIVREEVSKFTYLGTWQYTVVGVNSDETVNCAPVTSGVLPALNNVPIQAGPEGGVATPTTGQFCYIRFINGDPSRPMVVGNQAIVDRLTLDATATVKIGESVSNAVILAGGDAPVAREGDAVAVYFPPVIPVTGMVVLAPGTFVGTISFPLPCPGVITSGQPKVLA